MVTVTEVKTKPLTFKEICELEPRLRLLAAEIKRVSSAGKPGFCANHVWYRQFKPVMVRLVGWGSKHPDSRMHSNVAYDTVYAYLYSLLPNCRHPGTFC